MQPPRPTDAPSTVLEGSGRAPHALPRDRNGVVLVKKVGNVGPFSLYKSLEGIDGEDDQLFRVLRMNTTGGQAPKKQASRSRTMKRGSASGTAAL